MRTTQLIFKREYRWDLRKVDSVLLPLVFAEPSLIITIQPKTPLAKNYQKAGILNQLLIDLPGKVIASSQEILLFNNYQINFPQKGRFQLEFKPYRFLGKTLISVSRILDELEQSDDEIQFQPT